MSGYLLGPYADEHLDDIYEYTARHWGESQADRYTGMLFQYFVDVAARSVTWRSVPAEFGVDGYFGKCGHHFVYWKLLNSADVGMVAILHERMHQIDSIREIFVQPT